MLLLYWLRVVALVSSCVTFGLVTYAGGLEGGVGAWCMFCWIFSSIGILLILLVDIVQCFHTSEHVQEVWVNFPVTFSSYAALMCLLASIAFPIKFVKDQQNYDVHNHFIAASVFSWLATLAFLLEVFIEYIESECFMASTQGFLLVCQTYVAGVIFIFISNPVSYTDHAAITWCMVVYCICFICSLGSVVRIVFCNTQEPRWLKHFSFCAAVMYFSVCITWPVFKFNSHYPSHIYPPESCQDGLELCPWVNLVIITVLNILNFLLYSTSMYCFCMCSTSANEQYSILSDTCTESEILQNSSDRSQKLLGFTWSLHNYHSLNQQQ